MAMARCYYRAIAIVIVLSCYRAIAIVLSCYRAIVIVLSCHRHRAIVPSSSCYRAIVIVPSSSCYRAIVLSCYRAIAFRYSCALHLCKQFFKMSDSEEDPDISDVLKRAGYGQYVEAFKAQNITIDQVEHMGEEDFHKVGVDTVGPRLKIKQACRNFLKGNPSASPVVDKFMELSKRKRQRGRNSKRNQAQFTKPTRRIYVGWKHRFGKVGIGVFKIIQAGKGGGTRILDLDKHCTFSEMVKTICESYFPNGVSRWQGLNLNNLTYFIGTYTGEPITTDGEFTVGKYMSTQTSYPVRLYLHTETVNQVATVETASTPDSDTFLSDPETNGYRPRASSPTSDTNSLPDLETTRSIELPVNTLSSELPVNIQSSGLPVNTLSSELPVNIQSSGQPVNTLSNSLSSPDTEVTFNPRSYRLSLRRCEAVAPTASSSVCHSSVMTETRHQEVIEVFDSEDEELQMEMDPRNIEADIKTDHVVESFKTIIQAFQKDTVRNDSKTKLLVQRSRIVETTLKGLDRKSMDFNSKLYIKFSGELGQDEGGPRREFFRLVLKELHESRYFEGPEGVKIFSHDLTLLEKGHYRLIGRLVGLALAHDGPGLHFLSPDLYDIMVGQKTQLKDVDKLLTEEIKLMIKQLRDADNEMKEDVFLSAYGDQLLDLGVPNVYRMARKEKEALVELIKKHHIYYRISGEISQFTSGMNDVNRAWEMVTTHAELFKPVLCFKPKAITGEQMLSLFRIDYSEKGSNNRAQEEISIFGWESFIQSIEDGNVPTTMAELLAFISGASSIPPCGFHKLIDIHFYTQADGVMRLPCVSTCSLEMWIPRGQEPEMLSTLFQRCLTESQGFLKI